MVCNQLTSWCLLGGHSELDSELFHRVGTMNCYLWDLSYAANMVAQMFGGKAEDILRYYKNIDIEKAYAFTSDGKPSGVMYSYSPYAFTYLVSTPAKHRG